MEKKEEMIEEIKTELTEEELKEIFGEVPEVPEVVQAKPETHEEGELDE